MLGCLLQFWGATKSFLSSSFAETQAVYEEFIPPTKIQTSALFNGSIIPLPVSVLEVYFKANLSAAESRGLSCSCAACISRAPEARGKEGWKNRKEQPQPERIPSVHSCILRPRSLLPNFTSQLLPLNSKHETYVSSRIFFQKSRFPEFQTYFGSEKASGFNLLGLY